MHQASGSALHSLNVINLFNLPQEAYEAYFTIIIPSLEMRISGYKNVGLAKFPLLITSRAGTRYTCFTSTLYHVLITQVQATSTDPQGQLLQDWVHCWRTVPQGFKSSACKPCTEEKRCVPEKDAAVPSHS